MSTHSQKPSERFYKPRVSMRLANYDYRTAGAYAITICANDRQDSPFSIPVVEGLLKEEWHNLSQHFPGIIPDLIVIMPDHLHCIIWHRGLEECAKSVIDVIGGYKSLFTNAWLRHIKATNANYPGRLCQRSFYDHIIRDEKDLHAQRAYMLNNPIAAKLKRGQTKIEKACEYNSCGHIPFPPE